MTQIKLKKILKVDRDTMIGDKKIFSIWGYQMEYICGTDRNGQLMWIEGPLQPRTL